MNSRAFVGLALAIAAFGCSREKDPAPAAPSASGSAVPVDRLAPGELKPGSEEAYGLVLPDGMSITGRFADSIHAAGKLRPDYVSQYVKERVRVGRVELAAGKTIFPNAKIKGGDPNGVYEIEVSTASTRRTSLTITDVRKPRAVQGIDDAERLRRVGLTPNGRLLDPSKLE